MNILLIRFSAFGDVAMTVPVVYSVARKYPQHHFTVLSRETMRPLFLQMPSNVSFYGANLKQEHRGVKGIYRLFRELRSFRSFDVVADLHNVLRSQLLRTFFRLSGVGCAVIDKGKAGKRKLTRVKDKVLVQQPTSFKHYCDVLAALKLPVEIDFTSIFGNEKGDFARIVGVVGEKQPKEQWIGVAPFAAHKGKIYPLELMEQVVATLSERPHTRLFLFGAGEQEQAVIAEWCSKYAAVSSTKGLRMETELILMSHLDVMLSMDSANMHLASLVNLPVVSIWGATHPYCGFMGYGQHEENVVQIAELSCRPCSVFGNRPCLRQDYACLFGIVPAIVVQRVESVLKG
ncbi:MAG: glycosyltransferase family 9 protein [Bacteroidaceae bacterium]|nr:glycosyltransferase family 9 protein [Bacteroidaceae bacterium]